jgi:two-component system NarL family response regulator
MMWTAGRWVIVRGVGSVSVLVVDDHAVFGEAVAARLSREPDLEPVWVASTAEQARDIVRRYQPDVVVLDLVLGDASGLDLAESIRHDSPDSKVLVLTGVTSVESTVAALCRGARGWLSKTVDSDHLVRVIRGVAEGEAWLSPDLLGKVLTDLIARTVDPPPDALATLTVREREVLQCLVDGLTRSEIAVRLHVSANTVRTHTQNLLAKLGAHSTLESVALALRHGLRTTGQPVAPNADCVAGPGAITRLPSGHLSLESA